MAFSAGALDVANTAAPLVGNGTLEMSTDILIAGGAIGLGVFTIACRTLDTIGNNLMQLPILATLIVETVSASLISFLSAIGTPASLAVSVTTCIAGLGWGWATRTVTLGEALSGSEASQVSANALTAERENEMSKMGEETPDELSTQDLLNPSMTGWAIFFQMLMPSLSAFASYAPSPAGIV